MESPCIVSCEEWQGQEDKHYDLRVNRRFVIIYDSEIKGGHTVKLFEEGKEVLSTNDTNILQVFLNDDRELEYEVVLVASQDKIKAA